MEQPATAPERPSLPAAEPGAAEQPGAAGQEVPTGDHRLAERCRQLEAELAGTRERLLRLEGEAARAKQRLQQETEKVRAIQALGTALGQTLDLDPVLRIILDALTRMLKADRGSLYLVDDKRQHLISRITLGRDDEEIRLQMGEGIAGWVARTGRAVNLKDAYEDPRFNPSFDRATGYRTRSILCVPIHDPRRHRTIGVIQLLNREQGYFSAADEELLRALSNQAAITIENSKLFNTVLLKNMELLEIRDRLQEKVHEVDLLYELSQRLQRIENEHELVDVVLEATLSLLPCEAGGLLLLEEAGGGALRYLTRPVDQHERRGWFRLQAGEGLVGQAIAQGAAVSSNWLSGDPEHRIRLAEELGLSIRSSLATPLTVNERVLGAVQVVNRKGPVRRFSADDGKLLGLIADQAAAAVDLRQQMQDRAQRERLATIGQLMSSVLHDIKGPVSIISGYVQLMVGKDQRTERERYADILHRQFDNLAAMTQEVLAFARGETSLLVRRYQVHRFMAELEELLRQQVSSLHEGLDIELIVRDDYAGPGHFDQVKITRAICNLVRNSVEAMRNGGQLAVISSQEGDELVFTVSDTGAGIPEELKGRLFDTFVSGGKAGGTGLGLAIVRKIVEEHGGTIRYESQEELGTRFELRLPQPPEGAPGAKA